jgi:hypothetical protein
MKQLKILFKLVIFLRYLKNIQIGSASQPDLDPTWILILKPGFGSGSGFKWVSGSKLGVWIRIPARPPKLVPQKRKNEKSSIRLEASSGA